jgi:hypothetical protein
MSFVLHAWSNSAKRNEKHGALRMMAKEYIAASAERAVNKANTHRGVFTSQPEE